jgi:HEPN domain-containing protein
MQPPSAAALQEAREWLERAERDLAVTRQVLAGTPPLPDMAAYHAQQAAEKAFKAFLTVRNTPFRRTHDLVELQAQCEALDTAFSRFLAAAQALNPYATRFRYPGGPLAPPLAEAQQALQLAEGVVSFVQRQI